MLRGHWINLFDVRFSFEGPWLVGGLSILSDEVKVPFIKDPRGKGMTPVLPGTSIAGSLRAAAANILDGGVEAAERLFGHVTPTVESDGKTKKVMVAASVVEILGAVPLNPKQILYLPRGRTAIESRTGASKNHMLVTEEIVAPITYRIIMQVQSESRNDSHVSDLKKVLNSWQPYLGRGRSIGLGRGRVEKVIQISVNLDSDEGLRWWLFSKQDFFDGVTEEFPDKIDGQIDHDIWVPERRRRANALAIKFELKEPVHIGKHSRVSDISPIPVYRQFDRPVIPATSWKGVFRNRVQTIINLVGDDALINVTDLMFGSAEMGRGLLRFRDSYFIDSDGNDIGESYVGIREHVAIDRFSGGAKDSAKFTWECVLPGCHTELNIDFPEEEVFPECYNILKHVIRDINDGIVGIGAGISRGYGRLTLTESYQEHLQPRSIDVKKLRKEIRSFFLHRLGDNREECSYR